MRRRMRRTGGTNDVHKMLLIVLVFVCCTKGTHLLKMANAEKAEAVKQKRHGARPQDWQLHC